MADQLKPRQLDLLLKVAAADGKPAGLGRSIHEGRQLFYVYAYLAVHRQTGGATWDAARSYVTCEAQHLPGLASEVTGAIRHLVSAGLVELGPSGQRRAERPYLLTEAGVALLADLSPGAGGRRPAAPVSRPCG